MEITGKTIVVLPIESGTSKNGNAWQKQCFVVETNDLYPKKICFQLFGDRIKDCPKVGEDVKVSFDIESREYNGRWYTQLSAWKVAMEIGTVSAAPAAQGSQGTYPQQQAQPKSPQLQGDDLPF